MEVKYDISQYLASVKMSSKKRILVEGKDDKAHIGQLFYAVLGDSKIKIDTAENLKGISAATSKNNRAKIDFIHAICKTSDQYGNLYLLCDREYLKFNIGRQIEDLMDEHENDGNLNWTIGHSLENYFIDGDLIIDAFSFLTASEFKLGASDLFKRVLNSAIRVVAALTLSAKDIDSCSYPAGTIQWNDFSICDNKILLGIESWRTKNRSEIATRFIDGVNKYLPIVENSEELICSRICRGHTAILMLQRVFSACLYHTGNVHDETTSRKDANIFGSLKESTVASALSEAWIRRVKAGSASYPKNLVQSVA